MTHVVVSWTRPTFDDVVAPTGASDWYAMVVPEPPSRLFSDDQFFPAHHPRGLRGARVGRTSSSSWRSAPPGGATSRSSGTRRRHVGGVIVASMHGADPLPARLARAGVPVVACGRPLGRAGGGALCGRRPRLRGGQRGALPRALRSAADRHDRRAAGHGGRGRAARRVPRRSWPVSRRSIIAVGDFTLESGARPCANCSTATRTSTRCSWPPT